MKLSTNKTGLGGKGLVIVITLLLAFVGAMALTYYYINTHDRYDKEYIGLLGQMRVISQQMTKYAGQASSGAPETFQHLQKFRDEFARNLRLLVSGDPETGMPATTDEKIAKELKDASDIWKNYQASADEIIKTQGVVSALREVVSNINENSGQLLALTDEVATLMAQKGGPADQVYIASRQLMLGQRIVNNVNRVLEGGEGAVTAADRFGRDALYFGSVVKGLLNGDRRLNIAKVQDPEVVSRLREVNALFETLGQQIDSILDRSPEMFKVSEAVGQMLGSSEDLLSNLTELEDAYLAYIDSRWLNTTLANAFGGLALGLLFYLWLLLKQDGERRLVAAETQRQQTEAHNKRSQQAIMRLLDEMGDLADGDLTVHATVTEDITGAIADSMNYAIDALRNLVAAINDTAGQVSTAAKQTQETATQLASASEHQTQQIASASTAVNEMAISIEGVSENADQLAEEAQRSVDIAKKGAEAVQKTINGMDTIRDQIQETSKRIKRLGESSQEIGDIVELINDIAEQTNILALNAAIQAAMAGEAGRGFAVVADEVQRLAERSADATRRIEALVKTIQTDTNEAVISMEQSTSGVVAGAKLAEDAGGALVEIENVAANLADLVQSISNATRQQASAAANISDTMNVIQEITTQTSDGTNHTAASIGELASLADELKRSVAGFKLPE